LLRDLSRTTRLWVVLGANLALVAVLVIVGITAHSLGVLAEGADYLADAGAIGVSLLALYLSSRPLTLRHPHGFPRATRFAALINAGWLLVLSVLVLMGAIIRLTGGTHHVHGLPVLIVSGIAAVVMLGGALLLGGDERDEDEGANLNIRAVLLDTAADAAAAAGVAITRCHHLRHRGPLLARSHHCPGHIRGDRLPGHSTAKSNHHRPWGLSHSCPIPGQSPLTASSTQPRQNPAAAVRTQPGNTSLSI
jgi:cobalt-zinc-cadmium efflux system protein